MSSHRSEIVRIMAGTDARLFLCLSWITMSHYAMKVFSGLGWQTGNTTRVIPIITTLHAFIGCWGGGSGLSILATAAEALCEMLQVFYLEKKIKKIIDPSQWVTKREIWSVCPHRTRGKNVIRFGAAALFLVWEYCVILSFSVRTNIVDAGQGV